eukprot:3854802-Rhodomonas_salina.1
MKNTCTRFDVRGVSARVGRAGAEARPRRTLPREPQVPVPDARVAHVEQVWARPADRDALGPELQPR